MIMGDEEEAGLLKIMEGWKSARTSLSMKDLSICTLSSVSTNSVGVNHFKPAIRFTERAMSRDLNIDTYCGNTLFIVCSCVGVVYRKRALLNMTILSPMLDVNKMGVHNLIQISGMIRRLWGGTRGIIKRPSLPYDRQQYH